MKTRSSFVSNSSSSSFILLIDEKEHNKIVKLLSKKSSKSILAISNEHVRLGDNRYVKFIGRYTEDGGSINSWYSDEWNYDTNSLGDEFWTEYMKFVIDIPANKYFYDSENH